MALPLVGVINVNLLLNLYFFYNCTLKILQITHIQIDGCGSFIFQLYQVAFERDFQHYHLLRNKAIDRCYCQ